MAKEQNFAHPPRGHVAILAYDDVNDRWQVVECTADGYLKIRLQEVNGTVLIQQYMPSLLQPGINTYIGTAWQKQAPVWGFSDTVGQKLSEQSNVAATFWMQTADPDPGEVWRILGLSLYRSANVPTFVRVQVYRDAALDNIVDLDIAVVNKYYSFPFDIVLKAGQYLRFGFASATVGETCEATYWGYQLNVGM